MSKFLHPIFKRIRTVGADPEHRAFLEAIENQLHDLEGDVALMVSEMQIKRASGGWLDAWGDWYAVPREKGMDDDTYREYILHEVTKPKNTIPGIVEEIERHLPEGSTVHVHEPYVDMFRFNVSELSGAHRIQDDAYTRHAVIDIVIDGPLPPYLADIVHSVKAAGIRVYFTRDSPIWGDDGDGNLIHVRMYSLVEPRAAYFVHTQLKVEPLDLLRFNENAFNDAGALLSGRQYVLSGIITTQELYTDARRKVTTSRNTSLENIIDEAMDQEWLDDYFDATQNVITTRIMVKDPFDARVDAQPVSDTTSKLLGAQTKFVMGDSAIPINQYYDIPVGTLYDHGERGEATQYSGTPVLTDMVAWYDFSIKDNHSPGRERATDLSGNGNHGTLQNFNFTAESGYESEGLKFDGVDDLIEVPSFNRAYNDANTEFNFDFSLNLTNELSTGSIIAMPFTGQRLSIKNSEDRVAIGRYTTHWFGRKTPPLNKGNNHFSINTILLGEGEYELNEPSFLLEVYVNGELVEDVSATSSDYYSNVAQHLYIGWQATDASQTDNAYLDESLGGLKIYRRTLSAPEIAHNYAIEKERFGIE